MPRIRVVLEDDNGQPLTAEATLLYSLAGSCSTLDAIDDAVEEWRKKALPDIEKALLQKAQHDAIAKKTLGKVQWHVCFASPNPAGTLHLLQPEVSLLRRGEFRVSASGRRLPVCCHTRHQSVSRADVLVYSEL